MYKYFKAMYVLIYLKPLRERERGSIMKEIFEWNVNPRRNIIDIRYIAKNLLEKFFSSFSSAVVNNNQLITPLFFLFSSKLEKFIHLEEEIEKKILI